MLHVTVGIFGMREDANKLASSLAKKGTISDIALYSHTSSEGVVTYVCPNSESNKIQPLLECLNMIDFPVIVVNELTKEIGEIIIAVSEMAFDKGFFIAASGMDEPIRSLTKGTVLENFTFVDENALRVEIMKIGNDIRRPDKAEDPLIMPIDNCFKVKGVGTIALGIVRSGVIKKHDKVMIEPFGKEATVKGIQSQDNSLEEAVAGMRLGVNLRGVEPEGIDRGFIICGKENKIIKSSELKVSLKRNKFFKQELKENTSVMINVGLQTVSCDVKSVNGEKIALSASQPVAYTDGQRFILASSNDIMPRIIGSGQIE